MVYVWANGPWSPASKFLVRTWLAQARYLVTGLPLVVLVSSVAGLVMFSPRLLPFSRLPLGLVVLRPSILTNVGLFLGQWPLEVPQVSPTYIPIP